MPRAPQTDDGCPDHRVQVLDPGFVPPDTVAWIRQRLTELRGHAAPGMRRVTIRLVDDRAMMDLHARHMNDPSTTDVLTFVEGDEVDVAVCVDEAGRRAAELGHDLGRELLLYALHGLLHAAGFDDRTPSDHARMHAEEDRLLALIGVEPTFAPRGVDR